MGADEIAFDSSGVNISCGSLHRFPFKEYHSSEDIPSRINRKKLLESLEVQKKIIFYLENNFIPKNLSKGMYCLSHPKLDLYVDRKKISGVLLESSDNFIIVGIGLNILKTQFRGLLPKLIKRSFQAPYHQILS